MRHAITWGGPLLFAAVMLGSASRAAAVDVQGTYDGKFTCTLYPNGEKPQKDTEPGTVKITQMGQELAIDAGFTFGNFVALVSDDGVHTNKGIVGGGSCPNGDPLITFGIFGKANMASAGDGGSLVLDISGVFELPIGPTGGPLKCHVTAKRTSAADPGLSVCPPVAAQK